MAEAARALGYGYLVISDHTQSLGVAGGLDPEQVRAQRAEIDALNAGWDDFHLLQGCELEIKAEGYKTRIVDVRFNREQKLLIELIKLPPQHRVGRGQVAGPALESDLEVGGPRREPGETGRRPPGPHVASPAHGCPPSAARRPTGHEPAV